MTKQLYPLVSADVALFSIGDGCLQVLLVQRAQEPAAGQWALPGAVLKPEIDRDLEATARTIPARSHSKDFGQSSSR